MTKLAFKLGSRYDNMSAKSVYDAHFYHADNHNGKVLFTTQTKIAQDIDKLILMEAQTNNAFIAKVKRFESYSEARDNEYELPSQWHLEYKASENEQETYQKFGLSELQVLSENDLAKYINIRTKKPLINSISGANSRVYVDIDDVVDVK
ncbi:hypothetical protein [Streptococcus sp. 11273D007BW]